MMYSEWASVEKDIFTESGNVSVLNKFPDIVGKDVASAVVRSLAQNLSLSISNSEPSNLNSEKDVQWTMEVLCFGLSLPLSECDTIKDCVSVYCEWFSALTHPKNCVPRPVVEEPNPYIQEMLAHLHNVFVPRTDAGSDLISKQVVFCHRVLRNVQSAAENSRIMVRETWECLLKFLIGINNTLLATPTEKDGIGEQLCERVLSVLFEMWILSCDRCFPAPPLWKTFRELCSTWRHHNTLIVQWQRVNVAFTSKLLKLMYGPDYPTLAVSEDDANLVPDTMDNHCVAQCWFRFLHTLSNPVDLSKPDVIGNTPKFLHMALTSQDVVDPHHHECLKNLPYIFHKAMKGVSVLVDAFLGISEYCPDLNNSNTSSTAVANQRHSVHSSAGNTPPSQRKSRAFTVGSQAKGSHGSKTSLQTTPKQSGSNASTPASSPQPITLESRPPLASARPKVNSILHLFGAWLVEAAIVGVKVHGTEKAGLKRSITRILKSKDDISPKTTAISRSRTTSFHKDSESTSHLSSDLSLESADGTITGATSTSSTVGSGGHSGPNNEAGRAEACGTLCRIFCSHKTGEEILPVYLSRFYIALYYGLQTDKHSSGQVLANIIFHSSDLLRIDLDGVQILLPDILSAMEIILPELSPKFRYGEQMAAVDLRKASIHLLLSSLCLPLHFKELPIQSLFPDSREAKERQDMTFLSLKGRIIELLLRALTVETDPANTEMLLGGLLLCVQDLALCEEAQASMMRRESDTPTPTQASGQARLDTSNGLFGHAASLVCNRLMASWKLDLNIALAAMEVLAGLAKVKLSNPFPLMCKRTVNWICEFIVYQCSRPPQFHSKDLHSMIVAAFHCLTLWLVAHSYLMQDKECLHCVLEVVELGISGIKSQLDNTDTPPEVEQEIRRHGSKHKEKERRLSDKEVRHRASDVPKLKAEKELKPVSMRVKEAAEGLLAVIMDHVGSFPPPCGPESICSLLDEETLLKYGKDGSIPEHGNPFRYFVLDGTTIVGLLEQSLGNDQDSLPTVTALIRGPFGRHAWTMQLRQLPRNKKVSSKVLLQEPSRPEPKNDVGVVHNVKHRYFPEVVDSIPLVKADKSIPKLEETMLDQHSELQKLQAMIREQVVFENKVTQRVKEERSKKPYPNPETECKPPSVCHEFQTARLFLSHYGFLSLEALKDTSNSSVPPSLVMLDPQEAGFMADLEQLDSLSCRVYDTVHVFYVKSGQKMPFEILSNVCEKKTVQPVFLEFLRGLGWPVDVRKHAGWSGHVTTSWKIQPTTPEDEVYPSETGGSLYDGRQQVLYWADVASEVAFVVPSTHTYVPQAGRRTSDVSTDNSQHDLNMVRRYLTKPRRSLPALQVHQSLVDNKGINKSTLSSSSSSNSSITYSHITPPKGTVGFGVPTLAVVKENGVGDDKLPEILSLKPTRQVDFAATKPKSLSLDLESHPAKSIGLRDSIITPTDGGSRTRKFGRSGMVSTVPEAKIFVVWLESFEDHHNFPMSDLVSSTSTGLPDHSTSSSSLGKVNEPNLSVIYIHALQNGLFRVHIQGHFGKIHMGIPLQSGMVVSRRCIGSLVRQTAVNICRRKRLENDSYQPPHVKRKLKIKDIVDKYRNKLREPEFYTELFQDVPKC